MPLSFLFKAGVNYLWSQKRSTPQGVRGQRRRQLSFHALPHAQGSCIIPSAL